MRKINTHSFHRATRTTPRQINRQILLNLIREHEPISRADIARRMEVGRGMITSLVDELLAEGVVYEGATGEAPRGRKPKMLYVRTRDRFVIAIDIRFSRTYVMLTDFDGRMIALETFDTTFDPEELTRELQERIGMLLRVHGVAQCEGVGVVVPGMVDRRTGRVLFSPQLGWRDVDLHTALSQATGMEVQVENAPTACALAQVWLSANGNGGLDNFVYVSVSDGVGTGLVVNGRVIRGHADVAGEFGHISLNPEGPRCMCGLRGCWEAYTSNLATLARYFGLDFSDPEHRQRLRESGFSVADLISRARAGDEAALAALGQSAHYLGIGLAGIVSALNPGRIILGGEITGAWDLIGESVQSAARSRALTSAAASTPIVAEDAGTYPRLRGATALVVAPFFAAPEVA